jgi:hypothetical protein
MNGIWEGAEVAYLSGNSTLSYTARTGGAMRTVAHAYVLTRNEE